MIFDMSLKLNKRKDKIKGMDYILFSDSSVFGLEQELLSFSH